MHSRTQLGAGQSDTLSPAAPWRGISTPPDPEHLGFQEGLCNDQSIYPNPMNQSKVPSGQRGSPQANKRKNKTKQNCSIFTKGCKPHNSWSSRVILFPPWTFKRLCLSRESKNIFAFWACGYSAGERLQNRCHAWESNIQECVHAASGVKGGCSSSDSIVIFIAFARENAKVECENL